MKKIVLLLFLSFGLLSANAQCSFTYSAQGNTANFSHNWPVIGTMTIDSLSFNYGDGSPVNVIAPFSATSSHTYPGPGSYYTCMTAYMSNLNQPGVILCTYCDTIVIGGTQSCTVNVSATASGNTINTTAAASGGIGPYTYSYNLMPGNITNTTGTFTGLAMGSYTVCVTAYDAMQNLCSIGCDSVFVGNTVFCTTNLQTSVNGNTITANASATGGTPPYTYSYNLMPGNITNTTGVFSGLANGTYTVCVTATDANNISCAQTCNTLIVGGTPPGPCMTTITAGAVGATAITASASASFGVPPYTYSYTLNPGNITNSTGTFLGLTPGTYTVCATATDSLNQICTPACDTVILGGSFFCTTSINVTTNGNTVTAAGSAMGGAAPYTYSYTLNPGNITNSTGVFSGLANGMYTVCVTAYDANQTLCSMACDSVIVGNTVGCFTSLNVFVNGNTLIANGSAMGGVAPYTYSYTLNPGNITNSTGVFPGLANGFYTVCVTAIDAMQTTCSVTCDSAYVGNTIGCFTTLTTGVNGNNVIANGTAMGGTAPYTYSYTLNPGNITNSTGLFTGLANGAYSVCVTAIDANSDTCSIACDSVSVGTSTGCSTLISVSASGNTVTAAGSVLGGMPPYTFVYTLNPGSQTNSTGVFSGLPNGIYVVCVTAYDAMQNVCGTACDSVSVGNTIGGCAVNAMFSESISGLNVNFTNSSTITNGTITNYGWSFGDGNLSSAASPSHNYVSSGVYNVVLVVYGVDSNQVPCVDSFSKTITVQSPNAVNNVQVNKLSIYPNPTTKNITIDLPINEKLENLVLTDVSGRIVPVEYKEMRDEKLLISLKDHASGIYFIKLQTDANFYTSSIMKQE